MTAFQTFFVAFFFSFVGSIPPGTINLTVLQVGLEKKMHVAWRLALAAAIMEYPYAWIAVAFTSLILSSPVVVDHMRLITGVVMITLGSFALWSASKPTNFSVRFNQSGFRRGILLGLLNPMAIPFWTAMTTYLHTNQWINTDSAVGLHSYLLGVSAGGFTLLMLLAYLARKMAGLFRNDSWLKKIPGVVLIALGIYSLVSLLMVNK